MFFNLLYSLLSSTLSLMFYSCIEDVDAGAVVIILVIILNRFLFQNVILV